ncbi:3'-5' exonuclease [Vallitalea okinawensis]|uniref:3'-5' exonuclease n=1 Tax=Vallitalea okinawensis TaxID=2078660 RepID=UPI000CFBA65D|nr:3'-5' exonuclease [Vallitalea okinawensis]
MSYIVFDLEFNQALIEDQKHSKRMNQKCPFEIIQIGAVKLDTELNEVATFKALVKPIIYPKVHPFIEELTNITDDQLKLARSFKYVFEQFTDFIDGKDNIFGIWGLADMKELFRNVVFHKLSSNDIPRRFINIQEIASKKFRTPNNSSIGLRSAIEFMDIPIEKSFHDAFHDAFYTAEVFRRLSSEPYQIEKYDPRQAFINRGKRIQKQKRKIDYHGLIQQFEKMYNRKMTEDEKSIIKLAYKMGLTDQFQIPDKSK